MVDTQHFCLRWNNYQSSITSAFENLRDDEDFVDVTLACDGKSLKAHRVVLSACSPYFRELLKSTPCKHPVIVLQDVAFSDLHALVEFIYHGEVNVHQRSLSSFLKTAEVLRVSGLTQQADQTDRDELSHVRALAAGGNHLPFHEKTEEGFTRGGSPTTPVTSTPTPTTMQQLLRRAQIRRNERRTPDPHDESTKRPRVPSPPLNNNDATPTDFSMVKNNHLSGKVEGNGVHEDSSPVEDNIKCEPLELTGGNGGTGPNNEDSSDSGAAASDRPPASASSNEHEAEPEHTSTQNFLPESKLFTSTPGSFNFSMAALTTDHTPLSGLGHGLQTPDLAGTSQGLLAGSGASDEFRCEPCNKNLTSLTRLKRHIQNVHTRPSKEPICNICKRVYSSLNSLRNHKSIYHRQHSKNEQQRKEEEQSREREREQREQNERSYSQQHQRQQQQLHPQQQQQQQQHQHQHQHQQLQQSQQPQKHPLLASMPGLTLNSLSTQSAKKVFTCQLCGKMLCSKASLKRHVADKHAERQEEYRCVICERVYCSRTGNGMHPAPATPPSAMYRMPPPTAGGINEPQECPYCRRTFSCYYSLKRHFQDKHEQSDTLYVCEFCNRRYRTKNSLTTHKSLQHRGSSGMLKRLLKTSAIKNVLGSMRQAQMQQQPQ